MSALSPSQPPDFTTARFHMIEAQLRANKVRDDRILEAMGALPRENFVPPLLSGVAYVDEDIEVSPGRFLLEPMVLGRLLEGAAVKPGDHVLDIAVATGYSTAVLAMLAAEVTGVEADAALGAAAVKNLQRLPIANSQIVQMPFAAGCAAHAPYDVILINGSVEVIPQVLFDELRVGGRLVTVVTTGGGLEPVGEARLYEKLHGGISHRVLFNANVKPLAAFAAKPRFVFEAVMSQAVPAIEVEKLQQRLQGDNPPLVLDVREPDEFAMCAIPGAMLLPLGDLPQKFADLPKDRPIVAQCHHGGRSARAVAFLQQQGFTQVENLTGGIDAWARRIDKNMRTY